MEGNDARVSINIALEVSALTQSYFRYVVGFMLALLSWNVGASNFTESISKVIGVFQCSSSSVWHIIPFTYSFLVSLITDRC